MTTAVLLIARVETAVTFTTLLILCTPWAHVLKALRSFRLPQEAIAMLAMTHRYIFLLVETASQMLESRQSRTVGRLPAAEQRRMTARTAGVLLSKSIDLSNDVYLAMQSRGFRGRGSHPLRFPHAIVGLCWAARISVCRHYRGLDRKVIHDVALLFELQDVGFEYDRIPALRGLSLQIAEAESVALLGANGSGKSTLLRILDALYFPSKGSASFCGQRLTPRAAEPGRLRAFVSPESGAGLPEPRCAVVQSHGLRRGRLRAVAIAMAKGEGAVQGAKTLELMGIAHLRDRPPYRLSGGEKKRVALASVIVLDPEVLLLDEPTSTLDPRSQSQIIDLIQEWKGCSKTVITATHQLEIVEDIAGRIVVLEEGKVAASGTPSEILSNHELLLRANLVHAHRHSHGTLTTRTRTYTRTPSTNTRLCSPRPDIGQRPFNAVHFLTNDTDRLLTARIRRGGDGFHCVTNLVVPVPDQVDTSRSFHPILMNPLDQLHGYPRKRQAKQHFDRKAVRGSLELKERKPVDGFPSA